MENNLKAIALANNASSMLIWVWNEAIPDCLGFSITRIDKTTGTEKILSSRLVRFVGEKPGQPGTTEQYPVQGMKWVDGGAQEKGTYQWRITAMIGKPGNLKPGLSVLTNEVTLGFDYGPFVKACFNRGHLVSSQWLADLLPKLPDGTPDPAGLIEALKDPNSIIARKLGASLPAFVMLPYEEAVKEAGHVYSLYYELAAPEIVDYLRKHEDVWSMVYGNAGKDDTTNVETRKQFHDDGADVTDRFVPDGSIAHNKSAILGKKGKGKRRKPRKWMLQSANLTMTGLRTQSNHALYFDSPELAARGLEYYDRTLADSLAGALQSAEYRAENAKVGKPIVLPDGTKVEVVFSPSTEKRSKPKNEPGQRTFPMLDLAASTRIAKRELLTAKQGIYFLAFYPGFPSFLDVVTWLEKKKPDLFLRGAVSSAQALPRKEFPKKKTSFAGSTDLAQLMADTTAPHGFGALPSGLLAPITLDDAVEKPRQQVLMFNNGRKKVPSIISAAALEAGWQDWHKELLKLPDAHAIIHSKVIVIDPFGENPRIIGAASDNLGLKAGFSNDEVMLVISGNRALAQAYFVHIMDVISHFTWRYMVSIGQSTFTGELEATDAWQERYLTGRAHEEYAQWVGGMGSEKVA